MFRSWGLKPVGHFPGLFQAEFLAPAAFLPFSRQSSWLPKHSCSVPGSGPGSCDVFVTLLAVFQAVLGAVMCHIIGSPWADFFEEFQISAGN